MFNLFIILLNGTRVWRTMDLKRYILEVLSKEFKTVLFGRKQHIILQQFTDLTAKKNLG